MRCAGDAPDASGDVLVVVCVIDHGCISGFILDQTQDIFTVEITQVRGFLAGNDDLNIVLQQRIRIVRVDLSQYIAVRLKPLDDNLPWVPSPLATGTKRVASSGLLVVPVM